MGGLGLYKIRVNEKGADSAGLGWGGGGWGLIEVLHPLQLLTVCCQ